MDNVLRRKLQAIDWDFQGAWTQDGIHALHWYPGNFIPQVASGLVRLLSEPGDTVCDPFGGCGTTAVESVKLGRSALSVDLNPVGAMASQVKCTLFSAASLCRRITAISSSVAPSVGGLFDTPDEVKARPCYNAELGRWFAPETLRTLLLIRRAIAAEVEGKERCFFEVCLSHILKAACSQQKHWGWIADNVAPRRMKEKDVLGLFDSHCRKMIAALSHYYEHIENSALTGIDVLMDSRAMRHDCQLPIPLNDTVDAVITSPPYPCVIDFTKSQRLSYLVFGWDMERDRCIEIGARWKRFRQSQQDEYRFGLEKAFRHIDAIIRPGGRIGLVFDGEARKRSVLPEAVRFDIVAFLRESQGYIVLEDGITRRMSSQRLLDAAGSRNIERIALLEKPR